MAVGRHRGEPVDEAGTLPILDGLIVAVAAERDRDTRPGALDWLGRAVGFLHEARSAIVAGRESLNTGNGDISDGASGVG